MAVQTTIMHGIRLSVARTSITATPRPSVFRSSRLRPFSSSCALWQRRFTKDHEWVEISADKKTCTVGITKYAADAIGDVTWIEMPEAEQAFAAEDVLATIESVKAANEIYAPLSGTVSETNAKLDEDPKLVNQDAEGGAWIVKLSVESPDEFDRLLNEADYKTFLESVEAKGEA